MAIKRGVWWSLIFHLVWILPESVHKFWRHHLDRTLVQVRDANHQIVGYWWKRGPEVPE